MEPGDPVPAGSGGPIDDEDTDGPEDTDGAQDTGPDDPGSGNDGCMPMPESCNGLDDDCNGAPDDPSEPCNTGMPGPCAVGMAACEGMVMTCAPTVQPASAETCGDGIDNDCNGDIDEGCDTGGGGGGAPPLCNPMNPSQGCGPGEHCFPTALGSTVCMGPTGLGTQYDNCNTDADCVPNHVCVDTGAGTSYCMQWCTNLFDCPLFDDDCYPLDPPVSAGQQAYGVCWDGFP